LRKGENANGRVLEDEVKQTNVLRGNTCLHRQKKESTEKNLIENKEDETEAKLL